MIFLPPGQKACLINRLVNTQRARRTRVTRCSVLRRDKRPMSETEKRTERQEAAEAQEDTAAAPPTLRQVLTPEQYDDWFRRYKAFLDWSLREK